MDVSSHLPKLPPAQANLLQNLLSAGGGSVEATVIRQQPDGLVQVQVGRHSLSLQLPVLPTPGSVLTLELLQVDGAARLSLTSVRPPAAPTSIVGSEAAAPPPATSVRLSPEALSLRTETPVVPPVRSADGPHTPSSSTPPAATASLPPTGVRTALGPYSAPPPTTAPVMHEVTEPVIRTAPGSAEPIRPNVPSSKVPTPAPAPVATPPAGQPAPMSDAATAPRLQGATGAGVIVAPASTGAVVAGAQAIAPSLTPAADRGPLVDQPVAKADGLGVQSPYHAPASSRPHGEISAKPAGALPPAPQAALAQMIQQALPRQDSIVGLTALLAGVTGKVALPAQALKGVQGVLSQQSVIDGDALDGATLRRAIQKSGIFNEALLGAGRGKAAAGDLKSSLLGLEKSLVSWLGDRDPVEQISRLTPPFKGVVPRAKAPASPIVPSDANAEEIGKAILERTEAALSRIRLHQSASLPDAGPRQDSQWSLDLPVTIGGQPNVLHLQIHHDAEDAQTEEMDRGWQVRFAIHLGEVGEIGAQISLRGRSAGVLIWTDQAETAATLEASLGELRQQLDALGLRTGSVLVRSQVPPTQPLPSSQHHVDARR